MKKSSIKETCEHYVGSFSTIPYSITRGRQPVIHSLLELMLQITSDGISHMIN